MSSLIDFTPDDWRGNSAVTVSLPLSLIKRGWTSAAYLLARIYKFMAEAILFNFAALTAAIKTDSVYASPLSLAAMIYTTVLWASLIDLNGVNRLIPEHIAQGLEVVAALWVIRARQTLRRATTGPAALGSVVDTGAYSLVRHPVYTGRALLYTTFLLSNFNIQNALILLSVYAAQIYRIVTEENHLMKDSAYQIYAQKVRYRLIFGVY